MNPVQAAFVYVLFYLGVLLNILIQAYCSIRARSNSIKSFRTWLQLNFHDLGWRLAIDGVCWAIWMVGPSFLGAAAARIIPPCGFAIAPWIGFSSDRFSNSLGFYLRFTTTEMPDVAPNHVATSIPVKPQTPAIPSEANIART